jgi:hypothetical protein
VDPAVILYERDILKHQLSVSAKEKEALRAEVAWVHFAAVLHSGVVCCAVARGAFRRCVALCRCAVALLSCGLGS